MRKFSAVLSLLGLVALSQAHNNQDFAFRNKEVRKNRFGHMETVEYHDHGMQKTIYTNQKHFSMDYERQTRVLQEQMN